MSYEQYSSSYHQSSSGGVADEFAGAYGGNFGGGAQGNYSSYESSSSSGFGAGNDESVLRASGLYSSASYGGLNQQGQADASYGSVGGSNSSFEQQSTTRYATDAQGLFQDPNPQVVRRPAVGGAQTYTQRITVRFLQPPPVPPPGPLIVKEVRPPQPPPPPPLYIRQRPPPPPILPPVVIREAPPKMPQPVGTQVITKMLPPLPVPPRSVIIERLPPLPPKPRDVIVERWLPYRAQQKRRVIVQRAPPAVVQKPRNIIIYYEPPRAQVVRRFQNLGVHRANPNEYVQRYGTQLEDAQTLVSHARQAGVVEDISPPGGAAASNFQSSGYESYQSSSGGAAEYGFEGGASAGYGFAGGAGGGVSSSSYESSSSYDAAGGGSAGGYGFSGNANGGFGGGNSSYESYSSQQSFSY